MRTASPLPSGAILAAIFWIGAWLPHAGLEAQQETTPTDGGRGWIGISVETRAVGADGAQGPGTPASIVVTRVLRGSPAQEAGLRPGDRIVRVDETPATPRAFQRLARRIRPEQTVAFTVRRNGETRTLNVVAGRRSPSVAPPLPPEVAAHLDSVRDAVLQELDSLRFRLRSRDGARVGFTFRGDSTVAFRVDEDGERITILRRDGASPLPDVNVHTFLPDSGRGMRFRQLLEEEEAGVRASRRRLRTLQEELLRTRLSERSLRRRLARLRARDQEVPRPMRGELRNLEERTEALNRELQSVYRSMAAEKSRAESHAVRGRPDAPRATPSSRERLGPPPSVQPGLPPGAPRLIGRPYVAGARLQPLNPGLAEYFQVEEGVLVTEVVDGSPAAEADLRAGDVIVRVAGEPVTELDDLRRLLSEPDAWPVAVEVVRKGARATLRLER